MSSLAQLVEPVGKTGDSKPTPPTDIRDGDWIVDVIPYHADNDSMAYQMLPWLWKRLKDDGLLDLYYPDLADKSFPTFVKMLSSPVTRVILVVLRNPEKRDEVKDVIGFATWEPLRFGPATLGHAGFIFLKKYWDRVTSIEAGWRIMEWWFDRNDEPLDVALGLIALTNVLANRYVQRLGWTRMGVLPGCQQYEGKQTDAVQWIMTRAEYESKKAGR